MGFRSDVVEAGFVESLARPGGNVTGVMNAPPEVALKRLQLLVEAAPAVSKVAVLLGGPGGTPTDGEWEVAARSLGVGYVGLLRQPFLAREDLEPALERAVAEGADGLLLQGRTQYALNADLVISLAARYRLPATYQDRTWVELGGLMTYEVRPGAGQRRAAEYVDRILRGTRPADLPVENPTHYDLVVNLRTARALGLTLSRDFLARVDEVIE